MTLSNSVSGEKIRTTLERVEHIQAEIDSLNLDKSEIFKEAKSFGLCTKTLKKIIQIRKQDTAERQEQEAMLGLYLSAIGVSGTPLGDYAAQTNPYDGEGVAA